MQLWYAHKLLFAVLLTDPELARDAEPGDGGSLPYVKRGWPTVERAWTMLAKTNSFWAWPMIYEVGSVPRYSVGEEEAGRAKSSRNLVSPGGTFNSGEARRLPPMHPDRLVRKLERKRFTSRKADLPLVARLYRQTATTVMAGLLEIVFVDCGWKDAEFVRLAEVLPLFTACHTLRIYGNECGDAGANAIASVMEKGALPVAERLEMRTNKIGDAGCLRLAQAIHRGAGVLPRLEHLGLALNRIGRPALAALDLACARRGTGIECVGVGTPQWRGWRTSIESLRHCQGETRLAVTYADVPAGAPVDASLPHRHFRAESGTAMRLRYAD